MGQRLLFPTSLCLCLIISTLYNSILVVSLIRNVPIHPEFQGQSQDELPKATETGYGKISSQEVNFPGNSMPFLTATPGQKTPIRVHHELFNWCLVLTMYDTVRWLRSSNPKALLEQHATHYEFCIRQPDHAQRGPKRRRNYNLYSAAERSETWLLAIQRLSGILQSRRV